MYNACHEQMEGPHDLSHTLDISVLLRCSELKSQASSNLVTSLAVCPQSYRLWSCGKGTS